MPLCSLAVPASVCQGSPGVLKNTLLGLAQGWANLRGMPFETWISVDEPIVFCQPGLQMKLTLGE